VTTSSHSASRTTLAAGRWFLGALAFVVLRALPDLRFPLGRDQATYCLIGQGLLHGQLLYRDLWDNKPPGIFYVYALITKLFGHVMWSVGVVDILWLLAISCCLFWFAERYVGAPAAAIAVGFNAAWHSRWGYVHAVQPESFLVLFVFVAYFLLLPKEHGPQRVQCLGAGVLLGLAFWMKYNAVVFFPAVMLLPFLDFQGIDREPRGQRGGNSKSENRNSKIESRPEFSGSHIRFPNKGQWLTRACMVAAGFVATLAFVLGYFRAAGAWPALKEVQLEVLPRYAAMGYEWSLHHAIWILIQTQAFLGPWTEFMVLLSLVIAWARRELHAVAPVVVMAFSAYATTAAQGRFHPYYFETCFPFLAVFWGYVAVKVYEAFGWAQKACAERGWRLARGLLWFVLADVAVLPLPREVFRIAEQYQGLADWCRDAHRSYAAYPFPHPLDKFSGQMAVIDYLKIHSAPGDGVYVWGTAPLINFLAGRPTPSRFVSNLALVSPWGPARWREELVGELETTPPRFVVVARHDAISDVSWTEKDSEQCLEAYPALKSLLRSHYISVVNLSDFEIYERK